MKSLDFIQHNLFPLEMMDLKFRPRKPSPLIAFCTSDGCAKKTKKKNGRYYNVHTMFGAIKNVNRDEGFCPDCHSALFWQRADEVRDAKKKLYRSQR